MNIKEQYIGFIGQGFIGGNLANNFESRGFKNLVRYSLESKYIGNKSKLSKCWVIFLAVPTPTENEKFNDKILWKAMKNTYPGQVVVIKSTVPPDIIRDIQYEFDSRIIVLCPEFLSEDTAVEDTDKPERNIFGVRDPLDDYLIGKVADLKIVMPEALNNYICSYEEASLAKYAGNCFFYVKNMFFNIIKDLSDSYGCDWEVLHNMIMGDKRIHPIHTNPIDKGGRGAAGHCLIKDFVSLRNMVDDKLEGDIPAGKIFRSNESKNKELLKSTNKDINLLQGVYGDNI